MELTEIRADGAQSSSAAAGPVSTTTAAAVASSDSEGADALGATSVSSKASAVSDAASSEHVSIAVGATNADFTVGAASAVRPDHANKGQGGGARVAGAAILVALLSPVVHFVVMDGPNNADAVLIVCILLASASVIHTHRVLMGQKSVPIALTCSALLLCAGFTLLFEERPASNSPPPIPQPGEQPQRSQLAAASAACLRAV